MIACPQTLIPIAPEQWQAAKRDNRHGNGVSRPQITRARPKASREANARAKAIAKRHKRPPLSQSEWDRLRNKVIRVTCSDPWAHASIVAADACGIGGNLKNVAPVLAKLGIYPPVADQTPMRSCACPSCKGVRLWPPHYIRSGGYSVECAYENTPESQMRKLPPSPGVIDMARMKANARIGLQYHER